MVAFYGYCQLSRTGRFRFAPPVPSSRCAVLRAVIYDTNALEEWLLIQGEYLGQKVLLSN